MSKHTVIEGTVERISFLPKPWLEWVSPELQLVLAGDTEIQVFPALLITRNGYSTINLTQPGDTIRLELDAKQRVVHFVNQTLEARFPGYRDGELRVGQLVRWAHKEFLAKPVQYESRISHFSDGDAPIVAHPNGELVMLAPGSFEVIEEPA